MNFHGVEIVPIVVPNFGPEVVIEATRPAALTPADARLLAAQLNLAATTAEKMQKEQQQ